MNGELEGLALRLGEQLMARSLRLVTAESCTGGWIAQVVTSIPGSSRWFDCGLVTYSNQAKSELLGVTADTLARHGAVSAETAREMAEGARWRCHGDIAVAVTGVAGPDGGSPEKPVGTVWIGWAMGSAPATTRAFLFPGDREAVRRAAVRAALEGLLAVLPASAAEGSGADRE